MHMFAFRESVDDPAIRVQPGPPSLEVQTIWSLLSVRTDARLSA
jgi:hypothetical protein